jgi:hypothetical protein
VRFLGVGGYARLAVMGCVAGLCWLVLFGLALGCVTWLCCGVLLGDAGVCVCTARACVGLCVRIARKFWYAACCIVLLRSWLGCVAGLCWLGCDGVFLFIALSIACNQS